MEVGHNVPWVKSYMGHQHMWGQRSYKGHLQLLNFWLKSLKNGQLCIFMGLDIKIFWVDSHISP